MIPIDHSCFKKKFYRFEPFENQRIQTLESKKLWLSMPKIFNDPFDSMPFVGEPLYRKEYLEKIFNEKTERHKRSRAWDILKTPDEPFSERYEGSVFAPTNWIGNFLGRLRNVAITCFSEDWNNLQLWSYYANSHKGYCIEYEINFAVLLDSASKKFFQPINYASHYPVLEFSNIIESDDPLDKILNLLCTKNITWEHEREWRLIILDELGGKLIDMPNGIEVKSILAGCEMIEPHLHALQKICNERDINFEQLTKDCYWSRLVRPSEPKDIRLWSVQRI